MYTKEEEGKQGKGLGGTTGAVVAAQTKGGDSEGAGGSAR